jgi:phosphoserine phosphatase RsbX
VRLAFGVAARPRVGESVCGDASLVRYSEHGTLFGVIDALGHGPAAADAAGRALAHLDAVNLGAGLEEAMRSLDLALRGGRGAAALLVLQRGDQVIVCGVGNVELRTEGLHLPMLVTAGVLGAGVRRVRAFEGRLRPLGRMIVFSDGISGRFATSATRQLEPAAACRAILESHGRTNDDATVMVADVRSE